MGEQLNYIPEEEIKSSLEIEERKPHFDALIVFGAGVKEPRVTSTARETLSVAAKMRTIAAGEIFKRGEVDQIFLTGGKTGGENLPSEAEAMKAYLIEKFDIPEEKIIVEDRATNTIENLAHTVNQMDQQKDKYQNLAFLSNNFHLARIKELTRKFQLSGTAFAAEEMLKMRSKHYQIFLDKACDPNQNQNYRQTLLSENRWTRGLEEIPAYWLPNAAYTNPERLKSMIKAIAEADQQTKQYLEKTGLGNLEELTDEELQAKLRKINREMPPEEWANSDSV